MEKSQKSSGKERNVREVKKYIQEKKEMVAEKRQKLGRRYSVTEEVRQKKKVHEKKRC